MGGLPFTKHQSSKVLIDVAGDDPIFSVCSPEDAAFRVQAN